MLIILGAIMGIGIMVLTSGNDYKDDLINLLYLRLEEKSKRPENEEWSVSEPLEHVSEPPVMEYVSERELKPAIKGDVGIDIYADEKVVIHDTKVLKTGTKIALPKGYGAEIRPRSSISKKGLLVHHGTIDNGYRGELMVTVTNLNTEHTAVINKGDRVAQLVLHKIEDVKLEKIDEQDLSTTERGASGYGSTGR